MRGVFLFSVALAVAGSAWGNGLGGKRLEKVVGNQIVDVGTDQTSPPRAGAPIQFDFNLLKSDTRAVLPATNVSVNITRDGVTVLDNDLIMEPPLTLCVLTFPEEGDYNFKVTFYDNGRQLASATFPITMGGSAFKTRALYGSATLGIFLVALWRGYRAGRKKPDA